MLSVALGVVLLARWLCISAAMVLYRQNAHFQMVDMGVFRVDGNGWTWKRGALANQQDSEK